MSLCKRFRWVQVRQMVGLAGGEKDWDIAEWDRMGQVIYLHLLSGFPCLSGDSAETVPQKKKKRKKKENSIPASLSASSKVTIHSVIIKCANGPQHGAGLSALCFLGHQMTGEKTVISSDADSMIRIDSAKTGWSRQPMVAFSDAEPLSH